MSVADKLALLAERHDRKSRASGVSMEADGDPFLNWLGENDALHPTHSTDVFASLWSVKGEHELAQAERLRGGGASGLGLVLGAPGPAPAPIGGDQLFNNFLSHSQASILHRH